jgi:hypothetical protein
MIRPDEVVRGVAGAWRLACFDPAGARFFENTTSAFWRSFWAAVLVAPFYFFIVSPRIDAAADGPLHAMLAELAAYAVGWLAFPVAAHYLAGAWNYGERYLSYIGAYNWFSTVQVAAAVVVVFVARTGDFADETLAVLGMMLTLAIWVYQFFIARVVLGASVLHALVLAAADELISYAIDAALRLVHAGNA